VLFRSRMPSEPSVGYIDPLAPFFYKDHRQLDFDTEEDRSEAFQLVCFHVAQMLGELPPGAVPDQ